MTASLSLEQHRLSFVDCLVHTSDLVDRLEGAVGASKLRAARIDTAGPIRRAKMLQGTTVFGLKGKGLLRQSTWSDSLGQPQ